MFEPPWYEDEFSDCVLGSRSRFVFTDCAQDLVRLSLDKEDSIPYCSSDLLFSMPIFLIHSHPSPLTSAQTGNSFRSGI